MSDLSMPHLPVVLLDDVGAGHLHLLLGVAVVSLHLANGLCTDVRRQDRDVLVVLPAQGKCPIAGAIVIMASRSCLLVHLLARDQRSTPNTVGPRCPHVPAAHLVLQKLHELDAGEVVVGINSCLRMSLQGLGQHKDCLGGDKLF